MSKFFTVKFKCFNNVWSDNKIVFEGTNDDYIKLCELEKFETSGDIEDDYYDNNFLFGDSGDCELEEEV